MGNVEVYKRDLNTLSQQDVTAERAKRFAELIEQLETHYPEWRKDEPELAQMHDRYARKLKLLSGADKRAIRAVAVSTHTTTKRDRILLGLLGDRVTTKSSTVTTYEYTSSQPSVKKPREKKSEKPLSDTEKLLQKLPKHLKDNADFVKGMGLLGVQKGPKGDMTLGTGPEQIAKRQKLEAFLNFFNYPYGIQLKNGEVKSERVTPKGLVDKYFELLTGKNSLQNVDFIDAPVRSLLRRVYIESIFERMNSQGMTVVKSPTQNRYELFYTRAGDRNKTTGENVFKRLINGNDANKTQALQEDLDFGIMYSIFSKETELNTTKNLPLTEKKLIETIIKKHQIVDASGNIIASNSLELNYNSVIRQIEGKMEVFEVNSTGTRGIGAEMPDETQFADNIQGYQELAFLRSWLMGREYIDHTRINRTTDLVNEHWQYKSITAAIGSQMSDRPKGTPKAGDSLKEIAGTLTIPAVGLAIFAWLTGHGDKGFYILGGLLGAYGLGEVMNRTGFGTDILGKGAEAVGIKEPRNIDMLKPTPQLSSIDSIYEPALRKIIAENSNRKTNTAEGLPSFSDDFTLAATYKKVIQSGYAEPLTGDSYKDIFEKIAEMETEVIQKTDFDTPHVPKGVVGSRITQNDVKILVQLLLSRKENDKGDVTLLDYAVEGGRDIMSEEYIRESITGEADFDNHIHTELEEAFNTGDREKRKEVKEILVKLSKEKFYGLTQGFRDGVWEGIKSVPGKVFDFGKDAAENGFVWGAKQVNYIEGEIKKIEGIIAVLEKKHTESTSATVKALKDYIKYLRVSSKLASHEGIIDANIDSAWFYNDKAKRLFWNTTTYVGITNSTPKPQKLKFLNSMMQNFVRRETALTDEALGLGTGALGNDLLRARRDKIAAQITEWKRLIDEERKSITYEDNRVKKEEIDKALGRTIVPSKWGDITDRFTNKPNELLADILKGTTRLGELETVVQSSEVSVLEGPIKEVKEIFGLILDLQSKVGTLGSNNEDQRQVILLANELLSDTATGGKVKKALKGKFESYYKNSAEYYNALEQISIPNSVDEAITALNKMNQLKKTKNIDAAWLAPYQIVSGAFNPVAGYEWFTGYSPDDRNGWLSLNDKKVGKWIDDLEEVSGSLDIVGSDKSITEVKKLLDERYKQIKEKIEAVINGDLTNSTNKENLLKIYKALNSNGGVNVLESGSVNKMNASVRKVRIEILTSKRVSDYPDLASLLTGFKTTINSSSLPLAQKSAIRAIIIPDMSLNTLKTQIDVFNYDPIRHWFENNNLID